MHVTSTPSHLAASGDNINIARLVCLFVLQANATHQKRKTGAVSITASYTTLIHTFEDANGINSNGKTALCR